MCADTNSWDIDNSQTAASGIGSECTYDYVGIQGKIVFLLLFMCKKYILSSLPNRPM